MTTYLTVTPGVDMSEALRLSTKPGARTRLTKSFLRRYLRENPHKDFRVLTPGYGSYVNGQDAIRHDLTLQVVAVNATGTVVAMVDFQSTDANEWGYQAVVR